MGAHLVRGGDQIVAGCRSVVRQRGRDETAGS